MRGDAPIGEITFASWTEVIGSILDATFLCSQACIPHLSVHGKGSIINIGGVAAHTGIGGRAHVVAAKAGVTGLTRGLAEELAAQNITVDRPDARGVGQECVSKCRSRWPPSH